MNYNRYPPLNNRHKLENIQDRIDDMAHWLKQPENRKIDGWRIELNSLLEGGYVLETWELCDNEPNVIIYKRWSKKRHKNVLMKHVRVSNYNQEFLLWKN